MNQRWWLLTEDYQEDFREEWRKTHPGEQTPDYLLYQLNKKQFHEDYHVMNGIKIPCTTYEPLSKEDLEIEKKLKEAQNAYRLAEELYITNRVYSEIGWEEFLTQVENSYFSSDIKRLTSFYVPCVSFDAQCAMNCPVYWICNRNVEEIKELFFRNEADF